MTACGVKPSNVFTTYVPGSYELPVTAKLLAASKRVDVIINLGCLIKGETMHFEYICGAVANGLMQVKKESPEIFTQIFRKLHSFLKQFFSSNR